MSSELYASNTFLCVTAGSEEEFHRKHYSNYHLPEDHAGEEEDPSSEGAHELSQGKGLPPALCLVAPPPVHYSGSYEGAAVW